MKAAEPLVKSGKTLGCSGHEYLRLTAGQADFCVSPRARPWDHLPGALAFQEAGGIVQTWTGKPYLPENDFENLAIASTPELLEEFQNKLINDLVKNS